MIPGSLTIDRTSLGKAPLVISNAPGTFRLQSFSRPAQSVRATEMPNSSDVHGTELVAAVREQTSLPFRVIVSGSSAATMQAALDELDEALWQFDYAVTQTINGVSRVWRAQPASWASADGEVDAGREEAFFDVLAVTIPVYPIAGTA